ncbi:hypothetical protein FFLO_01395 [Filobasidium floriforme]|uniref:Aminoglycoside phosphotransferase domain-containing protein n=1 Tax=Filobasidium floriforme TaxID=5210 RepID=A0A8K0NSW7_9TREE|nr:hypothetical protein FFLO_01395 [Filobasidium floriforme]
MPEFYVMEFKEGNVFEDCEFPELDREEEKAECWKVAIKTLSILSTLPLDVLDLPKSFGPPPHKPVPFYERQVKGLLRVSEAQGRTKIPVHLRKDLLGKPYPKETTGKIEGEETMVPYLQRGAKRVGEQEKGNGVWGLVHGDYKIDNLIFKRNEKGRWKVVGVLDWELCTLGSPLSDLGNLTLPHSIDPSDVPDECKPASISHSRLLSSRGQPQIPLDNKLPGTSNLLKGLRNIPKDILCVPHVEDLEKYWVGCMQSGEAWKERVMDVWIAEGGKRTESTPVVEGSRWEHPIKGLAWVRSWMLWRLAIISQGIAARSALGQASSAAATVDSLYFDMFGRLAGKCAEVDEETPKDGSVGVKAKL